MLRNRFRNDKEEQATWVFWMVACCWKHRSAWRFYLFLQVGAAAQPFFKLFVYILSGWPVGSCWYLDPRSPMNSNLSADFRLRRRMGELAERQDGQSVSAKCCHLAKKSLRLEKWREIQHEKKNVVGAVGADCFWDSLLRARNARRQLGSNQSSCQFSACFRSCQKRSNLRAENGQFCTRHMKWQL